MKRIVTLLAAATMVVGTAQAQLGGLRILDRAVNKAVNKAADKAADRVADKAADKIYKGVEGHIDRATDAAMGWTEQLNQSIDSLDKATGSSARSAMEQAWLRSGYCPCDEVIFFDNMLFDGLGAVPSQWKASKGKVFVEAGGVDPALSLSNNAEIAATGISSFARPFTVQFDFYADASDAEQKYLFKLGDAATLTISVAAKEYQCKVGSKDYNGDVSCQPGWNTVAVSNKDTFEIFLNGIPLVSASNVGSVSGIGFVQGSNINYIKNVSVAQGITPFDKWLDKNGKITTHAITFTGMSMVLNPISICELQRVINFMSANPKIKLKLRVHTDGSSTDPEAAKQLAEYRTGIIGLRLARAGVDGERFEIEGVGDAEPIADATTPKGRRQNERVEFAPYD